MSAFQRTLVRTTAVLSLAGCGGAERPPPAGGAEQLGPADPRLTAADSAAADSALQAHRDSMLEAIWREAAARDDAPSPEAAR